MRRFFSISLSIIVATLLVVPSISAAYTSPGRPTGFVNDFAGMLTTEQRQELETQLDTYSKQTTHEIAVVTIPTVGSDETIETYAVQLFEEWGIGKDKQDNGILLLIARDDRKMRIEVGYGLEGDVTDAEAGGIIRNVLTPAFKQDQYYEGISAAVTNIQAAIGADISEEVGASEDETGSFNPQLIFIPIFLLLWISSVLARSKSWWAGGVVGGIIGIIAGAIVGYTFIFIPALIVFGLLLDFIVSKGYQNSKRLGSRPPWWTGGGFGGGGSSGGGFGGFGGGSSGGGGASGGW